jgi:hypothetical protein
MEKSNVMFFSPFDDIKGETYCLGMTPKSLIELEMMKISGEIRRKNEWTTKVFNNEIISKWQNELKDYKIFHNEVITPEIFNYIIDELRHFANLANDEKSNPQHDQLSSVDGVYETINTIPRELKELVESELSVFEKNNDWHPGSNNQVLNLIHPSLYSFINGRSIEAPNDCFPSDVATIKKTFKSRKLFKSKHDDIDYSMSKKYQWLPSDIFLDENNVVTIESYINNVHPIKNKGIYKIVVSVLPYFTSLFEKVLYEYAYPRKVRFPADEKKWYEKFQPPSNYDENDDEHGTKLYELEYNWLNSRKPIISLDFGKFEGIEHETHFNQKALTSHFFNMFSNKSKDNIIGPDQMNIKNNALQIIVKAANIILTPEKPMYPGGSWHIEGMKNESIVSTGIYYYHCENITQSSLHFRTLVREPLYEQCDYDGVEHVYGLENDKGKMNQNLGYIDCVEGKCIAFPNIYQHWVSPFELQDKTKNGIRKILVFFLIDPTKVAKSTKTVLPLQEDWDLNELKKLDLFDGFNDDIIKKAVPMSLNEANVHRQELMKERKYFVNKNNEVVFERAVNLCEH